MAKVLLIEDEENQAWVYLHILEKYGFETLYAPDGEKGLELAAKEKIDCLILDLVLPKKNGYEILAALKSDPKLKEIPVIILSNLGQDFEIQKGFELGANEYLVKTNLQPDDLIQAIYRVLKK